MKDKVYMWETFYDNVDNIRNFIKELKGIPVKVAKYDDHKHKVEIIVYGKQAAMKEFAEKILLLDFDYAITEGIILLDSEFLIKSKILGYMTNINKLKGY